MSQSPGPADVANWVLFMKPDQYKNLIITLTLVSGILCGYILSVIAMVFPSLLAHNYVDKAQISMVAGALLLGCFIASMYTGSLADRLGRKNVILITAIIYIIGIVYFIVSQNYLHIYIGRFIQGVAYGMCEIIIPLYLVEISATKWRGQIITAFKLANTGGALISSLVWIFIPTQYYQLPFSFALLLAITMGTMIFILPESPRWLISKNREDEAMQTMQAINPESNILQMLREIKNQSKATHQTNKFKELISKNALIPFLVVLAAVSLNQLTGINVFVQNSIQILKDSGIKSDIIGLIGTIAINGINFLAMLATLFLVERIGRRKILIIGTSGLFSVLIGLAFIHLLLAPSLIMGYITLFGIVLVVGFFAFGPGGLILVIASELLPNNVRGLAISIAFTTGALVGTFFVSWFGNLSNQIGYANLFFTMAFFVLCYFGIAIIIPETKGKSLEDISWQKK